MTITPIQHFLYDLKCTKYFFNIFPDLVMQFISVKEFVYNWLRYLFLNIYQVFDRKQYVLMMSPKFETQNLSIKLYKT